ncbi:hypothetical protein ACM55I_10995 [Flavobacterium sp. GB2R13]|uniref:hypothetical protein n=1 Tax=Flavobacterium algoris TaxID=3398733 RepID=UPI003A8909AC
MEEHWVKTLTKSVAAKIVAFVLLLLLAIVVLIGIFTDKHVKIFGIEFNDTINRDTIVKYVNINPDTSRTIRIAKGKINQTKVSFNKTPPSPYSSLKKDSAKTKYNFNEKVEATNLQIGNNNTQNNYGIQPRIINEEFLKDFFVMFPNKTMHVGFIAPNSEGEIINVKNQIIKVLISRGYNNIENTNGIRILLDSALSDEKLTLVPNAIGGISFYIPSARK